MSRPGYRAPTPDERDCAAANRDEIACLRDRTSGVRDDDAELRDQRALNDEQSAGRAFKLIRTLLDAADGCDDQLGRRDAEAARRTAGDRLAAVRSQAEWEADAAAIDHEVAKSARTSAIRERAVIRAAVTYLEEVFEDSARDRLASATNRKAAAADRQNAADDRFAAAADRDQAAVERAQTARHLRRLRILAGLGQD
jgi:hypothetical protein